MSDARDDNVVLALNSGSSSLKLGLYSFRDAQVSKLAWGQAEEIGSQNGRLWLRRGSQLLIDKSRSCATTAKAAEYLTSALVGNSLPTPHVIGHRFVHGGPYLQNHQRITAEVLRQIEEAITFAPLHLAPALDVLRQAVRDYPGVPQVACFDSVFHRTLPEYAARLPFGREFWEKGLRRYGFHGLSCESIVDVLGDTLAPRMVIAHLGNGCSITAVRDGASVETTMGLTPIGGVMMGTRSGDLDPGVLLHLLQAEEYDADMLDQLLNHRSGLLGVSGVSSDMRSLLQASTENQQANLAVEMFCYQVHKSIGAMATVLNGIDVLVFAGGIGEHAAPVRAKICAGLEHLGIVLDEPANRRNAAQISSAKSKCAVRVIESDEDLQIARHSYRLAKGSA